MTIFLKSSRERPADTDGYLRPRRPHLAPGDVQTGAGINWPPGSPVRVIRNSITEEKSVRLFGNDPDNLPREVIAVEDGRPIYKFSTDSPLRSTTGNLEALPAFAGQVVGLIASVPKTADLIAEMAQSALGALDRLKAIRTA